MHGFPSPDKLSQLRKLKDLYQKDRLGAFTAVSCVYQNGQKTCAVGALFNKAQLKDIRARGLNSAPIEHLVQAIGKKNIEAVTGFSIRELDKMQDEHDISFGAFGRNRNFIDWLNQRIEMEEANA
jgi:hypothetical protein